jgi:mRNA interferase RelE/StbE
MASYRIVFKPSVERDLRALPKQVVARVLKRIEELKELPLSRQSVKLESAENLYRVRVGDYRIIYGVDSDLGQVIVHYVRHRREAYRRL